MRVAFLSANARSGDAIGNQLAAKVAFFRQRGADARVFLDDESRLHPALAKVCAAFDEEWLAAADLIFVEYGQHFPLLDRLPFLANGTARVVFDYHGVTPAHLGDGQHRGVLERGADHRGLVWFADAALAHSQFACRELSAPTGFPEARLSRLGYPLDDRWFEAAPVEEAKRLRADLGLSGATVLLFVGRLAANKGLPTLVDALAQLQPRTPPVHALLVGPDDDLYRAAADRLRHQAEAMGVADRLHILGRVEERRLRAAYRAADVFVMPSLHEGFCIPVREAMACGVPVVACRAAALPETVGNAGLTFASNDANDLKRQIERVVDSCSEGINTHPLRVAVVVGRIGTDFVGGAEASLRLMAQTLSGAGHRVEVFTTAGDALGGIPVHRFAADPSDAEQLAKCSQRIEQASGEIPSEVADEYLALSLNSSALLAELAGRADDFDAILVGPYLCGLTVAMARAFPAKTVLVPCFHDEPAARLPTFRAAFERVGGVFYHTREERDFAQAELGVNVPGAAVVGTCQDASALGHPLYGERLVGTGRRYVLYAGRRCVEKNLPTLLDFAARYAKAHPERFTFAFTGEGAMPIPRAPWVRDLGFVSARAVDDLIAGADAVVQLSRRESLSLVALRAWMHGVPVFADAACAVLAGPIGRHGGGQLVANYDDFATALDDLWTQPEHWQARGEAARQAIVAEYGSPATFLARLEAALGDLSLPLAERMVRHGRLLAQGDARDAWRERFGQLVEGWLDAPAIVGREAASVEPRFSEWIVPARIGSAMLPVRVHNLGTRPLLAEGPARIVVRVLLLNADGEPTTSVLPRLLPPGQHISIGLPIALPSEPGHYQLSLRVERADANCLLPLEADETRLPLRVTDADASTPMIDAVQKPLVAAERLRQLPDGYHDVTEGFLAGWKRRIKQKLLHNFKHAYVDVALRQQSAFNACVVEALNELLEREAENKAFSSAPRAPRSALEERCEALEERLARLEARLNSQEEIAS